MEYQNEINNNHISELEKNWKKPSKKLALSDLVIIFPEAKEIIPLKIDQWTRKKNWLETTIKNSLTYIKQNVSDDFHKWFCVEVLKTIHGQDLWECSNHIFRLIRLRNVFDGKSLPKLPVSQEDIDYAVKIPIESIVERPFRKVGKNYACLCPFHTEKSASFFVFSKTNTFCCFGCGEKGNSITLVKKLYNFSFIETVKYLNNY